MEILSWVIIIGEILASLFIIGFGMFSLYIGEKSIFHGSGLPTSMAQTLLSSVHITPKYLLEVLVIVILSLLMVHRVLSTEAGLPLLSAVIGLSLIHISEPTRRTP